MYSVMLSVFSVTLLIGLSYALPPFEIRSASSQRSEAAEEWIRHLQASKGCLSELAPIVCPSSSLAAPECVSEEQLCDGNADCPRHEDESAIMCLLLRSKQRAASNRIGRL